MLTLGVRKKCQHILTEMHLVGAFVTRKQAFFFFFSAPLSTPPPSFFLHLQHLQDGIAKLRGQNRFIIVMQKKLKCYPEARKLS